MLFVNSIITLSRWLEGTKEITASESVSIIGEKWGECIFPCLLPPNKKDEDGNDA